MNVQVERLSNVEVKVVAEVPAEDVDRALKAQYRDLARSVTIRGFRKGKAPRHILEARFGKQVLEDTTKTLVWEHLDEALTEAALSPLGEPKLENDIAQPGQPLRFTLHFEVWPEVEVKGYRDIQLPPLDISVSDEDVDAALEDARQRAASLVPVDEGVKADTGAHLTVSVKGSVEGEPVEFLSTDAADIELGSGDALPGIEDALMGLTEGETTEFDLPLPDDFPDEERRGKSAHFVATVSSIKRKETPELDDEFAKDQGEESLDALKAKTRADLEAKRKEEAERERAKTLTDQLIEANPFDMPPSLLLREIERRRQSMIDTFTQAGMEGDQVASFIDGQSDSITEEAERTLREYFLLLRIGDAEEISISDEDINAHMESLAERSELPIQRIRAYYAGEEEAAALRLQLRETRVRDMLMEWAAGETAEETPAEEPPAEDKAPAEKSDDEQETTEDA